jgi:hypothetical protein
MTDDSQSDGSVTKPPEPTQAKVVKPLIGSVNVLEASVGAKGTGKSTLQCIRADELVRQWGGAYVVGHSLGSRLPDSLPDGYELPIVYHRTMRELEAGLRKHPAKWHILAPGIGQNGETADDLLRYVIRLSDAIKKDAYIKAHPWESGLGLLYKPHKARFRGVRATPIIVILDEGVSVQGASRTKSDANMWFMEVITSLRHLHTAVLYAVQDPTMRSWRVLGEATDINVFALRHEYALQGVRSAGATDEELDAIAELPSAKELESGDREHSHVRLELKGRLKRKSEIEQSEPIDLSE